MYGADHKALACPVCVRVRKHTPASLLPNLYDASLSSLSLIGNLTLITPVVVIPPMTLMTSMTSTRRSTGETYPLECLSSLTPMREQAGRTAPLPAF